MTSHQDAPGSGLDLESRHLLRDILPQFAPQPGMSAEDLRSRALEMGRRLQGDAPQMDMVRDVAGPVPARLYFPGPDRPAPVLIWAHGGGFTTGGLDTHDRLCRRLAAQSGCAVLCFDYRLAPDHKFPAAIEDCRDTILWIIAHGDKFGIDNQRVAIGGSSAGGNLAIASALMMRDARHMPVRLIAAVYPVLDLEVCSDSARRHAEGYQLTTAMMRAYIARYLEDGQDLRAPYLSPLHAPSLAGLARVHLIAAEFDPLVDDSTTFADRLRHAKIPVTLSVYPGVMHGFFAQAGVLTKARQAQEELCAAVRLALSDRGAGRDQE